MFEGAFVALVTPFKDGRVDEETLRRLVDFQIESGTSGIVPCGTTGESATLSHAEHKTVVEVVIEQAAKRVPVIAGAGSNNTAEAIELTLHAKQAGADAALHITPYYNKPTQEGIYQHFKAIAEACRFPLVPYNIAGRTAVNIETPTMARIAELDEVVAVKEASGSINQMVDVIMACKPELDVLSGDDGMLLPLLAVGGKGVISVVNNLVPDKVIEVVRAWQEGDTVRARQLFFKLLPLCKAMFIETNPMPAKTAMEMMGLIPSAQMRLPMCQMQPANKEKLAGVLKEYGLIT